MKRTKRILAFLLVAIVLSQALGISAFGAYASRADNYYNLGYRFTAEFTEIDGGVRVTLGTIRESDADSIDSLISTYQPVVYCKLYYGNGETTEFMKEFDSDHQADVSFVGAASAYVDVQHLDESAFAIRPDGVCEASYIYGDIDSDYDPVIFTDVADKDLWFYDYIYISVFYGFLNGEELNRFCPDRYMTYAQAITIAARMNAVYYGRTAEEDFTDTSPWYQTYVDYASEHGIVCEFDDYDAAITRREYVHIFRSALPDDAFQQINELADDALPDVKMGDKYADDIYLFYRAGILNGVDDELSFNPDAPILRSEVSAIICRLFYFDRQTL